MTTKKEKIVLEEFPEEYLEALKDFNEKREAYYAIKKAGEGEEVLEGAKAELEEARKLKKRLYARYYYHKRILGDEEKMERRRDLGRENKKKELERKKQERRLKRDKMNLLKEYDIDYSDSKVIILKKKN